MNYKKIYDDLIQHRKIHKLVKSNKCYCETHHITPRCMNGSDNEYNLINLTAREHYIAHLLLWKHYKDINPYITPALLRSITCMQRTSKYISGRIFQFNSLLYEHARLADNDIKRHSITITNGKTQKKHDIRLPIPNGWYKGSIKHNFISTKMITNGKINKRIKINEQIPDGFRSGTAIKKKRICITNGKINKYIDPSDNIPDGWRRGSHVKPRLNKIAISYNNQIKFIPKNSPIPENWHKGNDIRSNKRYITNGVVNKMININDSIPDGWIYGITTKCQKNKCGTKIIKNELLQRESKLQIGQELTFDQIANGWEYGILNSHQDKLSKSIKNNHKKPSIKFTQSTKGRIWVNDGKKSIRVYPHQIPDGFVKGRLCK